MLIYKMTHIPTGRFYIGSLKDSSRWDAYNTSSETVEPMLLANPEEWRREVLYRFLPPMTYENVVDIENQLIKDAVKSLGWGAIWNHRYGANAYSPEAMAKATAAKNTPSWKLKRRKISKDWFINNPEAARLRALKISKTLSTPEQRKRLSDDAKEWARQNPELERERQTKANVAKRMPEARAKNSLAKEAWHQNNPEAAILLYEKARVTKGTPAYKESFGASQRKRFADPAEREKTRVAAKVIDTPERRKKLSQSRNSFVANNPEHVAQQALNKRAKQGKWIEVGFDDGVIYRHLGRADFERTFGCLGINAVISGKRAYATCKLGQFAGKRITRACNITVDK